jgi:hypothetical protein
MANVFEQMAQQDNQDNQQSVVPTGTSQPVAQAPAATTSGNVFEQMAQQEQQQSTQSVENDPSKTGEITNDVGNKVIVPKDGESFADTMKRAVAYHNSLTPEQRQAAIDKELKTMPGKVATTLAAAPVIGAVGSGLLAAPGEIAAGVRAIPGVTEALLKHAETKAAEWAAQYPNLISVAKALGIPASTAGVLGWLYHNSKR